MTNCSPSDPGASVEAQLADVYSSPVEASKQLFHPSRIKGNKTFLGLATVAEGGNKHVSSTRARRRDSIVHNKAETEELFLPREARNRSFDPFKMSDSP